jgi:hypothetical protein
VGAGDISATPGGPSGNDQATALLLDTIPGTVFTLGDNAYESGTTSEYADFYAPTWGRHFARTMPVPGNHEYQTPGAAGYFAYFAGVQTYYAWTPAPGWRAYALNSEIAHGSTSAQVTWLQGDLAANPTPCVLAYWHKPRFSSGSTHGGSAGFAPFWNVLYSANADLVLSSHEHNYERFAPQDPAGVSDPPRGIRQFVVGTGGKGGAYLFGPAQPNSEVRDAVTSGVLKLTLHPNSYDFQFVPIAGQTFTDSGSQACH